MKTIVIYYSWMGNTEAVAKVIQQMVGGDIKKVEEVKQRKKSGFGLAAFSALVGLKSKLKSMDFSLKGYENVFIGTPVWAAHSTPAINTFLSKADLKNKKIHLFITKADDKEPQKVYDSLANRIEKHGGKVADRFSVTTKMNEVITPESVKESVSEWIKKANINNK